MYFPLKAISRHITYLFFSREYPDLPQSLEFTSISDPVGPCKLMGTQYPTSLWTTDGHQDRNVVPIFPLGRNTLVLMFSACCHRKHVAIKCMVACELI